MPPSKMQLARHHAPESIMVHEATNKETAKVNGTLKGYVALATYGRVALILRTNGVIECDVKC